MVDAAFLLQAAHELAEQEKKDTLELEGAKAPDTRPPKPDKAATKAEKLAMKQAEKDAEAAARERSRGSSPSRSSRPQ